MSEWHRQVQFEILQAEILVNILDNYALLVERQLPNHGRIIPKRLTIFGVRDLSFGCVLRTLKDGAVRVLWWLFVVALRHQLVCRSLMSKLAIVAVA